MFVTRSEIQFCVLIIKYNKAFIIQNKIKQVMGPARRSSGNYK